MSDLYTAGVVQDDSRIVRAIGTVAAVAGLVWLVLLQEHDYGAWRLVPAVLPLGGLLLRIEAAIAGNASRRSRPES